MKYSELKRLLKKKGCYLSEQSTRHERWYSEKTGLYFPVGRHDSQEVPPGTLKSIKRDAGIE